MIQISVDFALGDFVDQPRCHEAEIDRGLRPAFFVRHRARREGAVECEVPYDVYQVFRLEISDLSVQPSLQGVVQVEVTEQHLFVCLVMPQCLPHLR